MIFSKFFDRVYIRIGEMYDTQQNALTSLDLMELIHEVAKANPEGDGKPLYDATTDKVYEKRTKKYIVHNVNKFIADMRETLSIEENMASYASLKQLNHLIRAFCEENKQISCFSLVYVYSMYTSLNGKSSTEDSRLTKDCINYVIALYDIVRDYHENYPEDEVAAFLVGCLDPILIAIQKKNSRLTGASLPAIPRKHPKKIDYWK